MVKSRQVANVLLLAAIWMSVWTTFSLLNSEQIQSNTSSLTTKHFDRPEQPAKGLLKTSAGRTSSCQGRGQLLRILEQAKVNVTDCTDLPTWEQVASLYGESPVIIGQERCEEFRRRVQTSNNNSVPRIAGLYNTGTNALAKLWEVNWNVDELAWFNPKSHFKFDVPWGKHVPLSWQSNVTVPPLNPTPKGLVLPVVLVRDPFWWMQSMCKNPYGAKWQHSAELCPNLVQEEGSSIPVTTKYTFGKQSKKPIRFSISYDSLVHLWNAYYREYLESRHPRLLIRFEDILFHGPAVLQAISDCVGVPMEKSFEYFVEKSKHHGEGGTGFLQALVKYGSSSGRVNHYNDRDLAFAVNNLDSTLLQKFNYQL